MTMKALEEAKKKADEGKYEEGRQLLMAQKELVAHSATSDENMVQCMTDDMEDVHDGMIDESRYRQYGRSRAVNCEQAHSSQVSSYSTQAKSQMIAKLT